MRGLGIPKVGLGTWLMQGGECERAVEAALEIGYRHLDTAQIYRNEGEVGRAVERSGLRREELWITTKVWREHLEPAVLQRSVGESLAKLRTEHVDLLLVHWPNDAVPLERTLEALGAERSAGRARHIGVSNFPRALLRRAVELAPAIAVDQVELHAYLQQRELCAEAERLGIQLIAYSPLARGQVAQDPVLHAIGKRYGKSATQVALRWSIERGHVVIPKAAKREHLEANFAVSDFELEDADRAAIEALDRGLRTIDPPFAPAWDR